MRRSERLQELFDRERLSSFLPYEAYDPETGVFLVEHGAGVVFECLPRCGVGIETIQVLEALYAATFLPPGTAIQVMLYASPSVGSLLALWSEARGTGPLFSRMAQQRIDLLRGRASGEGDAGLGPAPVRDFRLLVSVTVPTNLNGSGSLTDRANELFTKVEGLLQSMHLYPRKLSAQGLIGLVFELLNPRHPVERLPVWDETAPLRDQTIFADSPLRLEAAHLVLDGRVIKSLSVKQYPQEASLATMNQVIGDGLKGMDQIPTPFCLTLNALVLDLDKDVKAIEAKAGLVTYQSLGVLARILPKIQEKKEHFDVLLKGLGDGHRLIKAYLHLALYGREAQSLDQVAQQVVGLFRKQGFILQEDHFITLPLLLASLPMGLGAEHEKKLLKRAKTVLSSNAAFLSPVCADWKGTGSPALLLISRRGQVMLLDLFDSPGNYNAVVAASSGSGKSFLVNELCLSYLAAGGQVWVIDIGRSYAKLCRLLDGDFIEFRPDNPPGLNPFSRVKDLDGEDTDLDLLIPIIGQMASPSKPLSDLERSFIERAIRKAFGQHQHQTTITAVAEALANSDDARAKDLATMLFPYTRRGRYGRFFEGEMTLRSKNPFVVLELEELRGKGDLRSVVLLLLIYYIQTEMYLGERKRKKLVVIDEAWDLLGEGNTAKFVEHGYRRFRKYNGGIVTITQGINDLAKTDAGRAALENSDFLFLLRQKAESLMALKETGRLLMDQALFELLSSVHTVPGRYSEVYVRTPIGAGIGRLMVDPFTHLVYTTNPAEYARVEAYQQQGLNLVEAIERCLG
ncbi:MAG: type IV secretion system protein TraC [Nitrospirota bacterium]